VRLPHSMVESTLEPDAKCQSYEPKGALHVGSIRSNISSRWIIRQVTSNSNYTNLYGADRKKVMLPILLFINHRDQKLEVKCAVENQ
jgi:hypothetical protein